MKMILTLTGMMMFLSACGSMTKAQIDKERTGKVKNVAIVGLHVAMQEPQSLMGDMKKLGDLTKGKVRDANQQHDTADEVYTHLRSQLSQNLNWNMLPPGQITREPSYQALVTKYTTGLQVGGTPLPSDYHKVRPHGMLDADPFIYKISQADREALMDQLRVDALVVDFLLVGLNNKSMFGGMVGAAKYQPKAQNIIRVFVRGQKDPVWFDTWAWGEGDKALQATMNFVEDKPLLEQVVVASKKSIGQTMDRYKNP